MSQLVEAIRVENGVLQNIGRHSERMNRSIRELFNNTISVNLEETITVPAYAKAGIYKCRVEYDEYIRKIDFVPYEIAQIKTLRFVEDDTIQYRYKYIDRQQLEEAYAKRGLCDDVIIVRKGMITDSSYANVIALDSKGRWHTPTTFLLEGTKRAELLNRGKIKAVVLTPARLRRYKEVRLINAMRGIDETEGIPTDSIEW